MALKLTNRLEFVVLLFAAWRIGATITPVNPSMTDAEVDRQLTDSGARLLVVEDRAAPVTDGPVVLAVGALYEETVGMDHAPHADSSTLALLIYTSGSTGVPKGVMLDHANIDAMAEMGRLSLELGPTDGCLLILPLFHVNGIVVSILTPLLAGASVVIAGRRFDSWWTPSPRTRSERSTRSHCGPATRRLPDLHRHTLDALLAMMRGEGVGKMIVKL